MNSSSSIGIFDSGIGGLTVAKEVINLLPSENIIYLGDTARVPYGARDKKTITKFALELEDFLLKQDIKIIVVACNTISATCLEEIKNNANGIPVIDVISPTVEEAIKTAHKTLGVIGTRATISSEIYPRMIKTLDPKISVKSRACPLFVPMVEEGFVKNEATTEIAEGYLTDFKDVESLILGCTHYPMLMDVISEVLPGVNIIDSARPTAKTLAHYLEESGLKNKDNNNPQHKFLVTDSPQRSQEIADLFFDGKFPGVIEKVSL